MKKVFSVFLIFVLCILSSCEEPMVILGGSLHADGPKEYGFAPWLDGLVYEGVLEEKQSYSDRREHSVRIKFIEDDMYLSTEPKEEPSFAESERITEIVKRLCSSESARANVQGKYSDRQYYFEVQGFPYSGNGYCIRMTAKITKISDEKIHIIITQERASSSIPSQYEEYSSSEGILIKSEDVI